jgi:hypothetical protein
MAHCCANVNNMEAHVNEPNEEHDQGHAGETSEGHGKDHGEHARKEAHQPRGAAPGLQLQTVQASGSRKARSGEEERRSAAEEAMSRLARSPTTPTTHQFTELTAQTVLGALPAQAYRRVFEMAGLRVPPRESDTPAARDMRAEILGSTDAARHLRERQRYLSNRAVLLAEIRAFDITHLGTDVPELEGWHYPDGSGLSRDAESPEDEGAVVNQRQAEKVQRLMQLYSAQDITGLAAEERAAQEQEMMEVYTAFDEEGL